MVQRGLAADVQAAAAMIMAGTVYSGTQCLNKAGLFCKDDIELIVKGKDHPYVSRGGVKLAAALDHFSINPKNFIALDIGASTGGFTDVLLRRGAAKVYAVDSGFNQLDWRLRTDARVVVMEKTNARDLSPELIPVSPDIIVCDASFISLKSVLPAALSLAKAGTYLVALIKPQFEVAVELVPDGGVVRDAILQEQVCQDIQQWLQDLAGWHIAGLIPSPITGAQGNKEFLIAAKFTK